MKSLCKIVIGVSIFLLFVIPKTHAQLSIQNNLINESDIDFKLEPEYPGPHERVTITIQSFVMDLDKASITWTVDGKDIIKGFGVKMLQFTAKGVGQETRIKVVVEGPNRPLEKTFVFQPSTLDLLWEAVDAYAPPFYKGKKLPVFESIVKVAGIPDVRLANGQSPKDSDIIYTWRHERKVVQDQSGYGKNGVLIKKNRLRSDEAIDVDIATRDGAARMSKRIRIPTFLPEVTITPPPFTAIPSTKNVFAVPTSEINLIATPYNFTTTRRSLLPYQWVVGTQSVSEEKGSAIRIRKQADTTSTNINVKIESPSNFFESAGTKIQLEFK